MVEDSKAMEYSGIPLFFFNTKVIEVRCVPVYVVPVATSSAFQYISQALSVL